MRCQPSSYTVLLAGKQQWGMAYPIQLWLSRWLVEEHVFLLLRGSSRFCLIAELCIWAQGSPPEEKGQGQKCGVGRLSCTCTSLPTVRARARSSCWHLDPGDLNLFPSAIRQCLKIAQICSLTVLEYGRQGFKAQGVQVWRLQRRIFLALSPSRGYLHPLADGLLLHLQVHPCSLCFCHHMVFPSDSHCLTHPSYKDLSDCTEPIWIIEDSLPILRALTPSQLPSLLAK